jgi:hypothetical protein
MMARWTAFWRKVGVFSQDGYGGRHQHYVSPSYGRRWPPAMNLPQK